MALLLLLLLYVYPLHSVASNEGSNSILNSVFRVNGASNASVNGVYLCKDDGLGKCYSTKANSAAYVLYQTFGVSNGTVQKRWYIAEVVKKIGGSNNNLRNLYGVVQNSEGRLVHFGLNLPWKNLLDRSIVESSMEVKEVNLMCVENNNNLTISQRMSSYTEVLLLLMELPSGSRNVYIEEMKNCADRLAVLTNTDMDDYKNVVICLWTLHVSFWSHAKTCFGAITGMLRVNGVFEGEKGINIADSLFVCASNSDVVLQRDCAIWHAALLHIVLDFINVFDVNSVYKETARIIEAVGGRSATTTSSDASNGIIILIGIHSITAKLLGKNDKHDHDINSSIIEACIFLKKYYSFSEPVVQDILTNACFFFSGDLNKDSGWDASMSLAMALLGIGEIEVASYHIRSAIIGQTGGAEIGSHEDDVATLMSILRDNDLFFSYISNATVAKLLESPNIRSSLILRGLLSRALSLKNNAFSVVLGSLFQSTAPTILFSTPDFWFLEAAVLRVIVVDIVKVLLHIEFEAIDSTERDFVLMDPNAYFGAPCRGLFLLAYQGVSCLRDRGCPPSLLDFYLPSLYYKLVQRANPAWHWGQLANRSSRSTVTTESYDGIGKEALKVGFLSAFFFRHSVGRLMAQLIIDLNKKGDTFDVFLITFKTTANRYKDDIAVALEREISMDRIIILPSDVKQAGSTVKDITLDILVFGDIFMDSVTAHVAMMRMATYQIAFWGHPYSSGYPSIDFFVSSENYEPIEYPRRTRMSAYSEQIVLFDTLSFSMFSPMESDTVRGLYDIELKTAGRKEYLAWIFSTGRDLNNNYYNPSSLLRNAALVSDNITTEDDLHYMVNIYGCQQSIMKMHPIFDLAILKILQSDPLAVILLSRNRKQLGWHKSFVSRLYRSAFHHNATDLLARLVIIDQASHHIYEAIVCGADVTLDTFPFGGGVTLSDSLSCGLKVSTSGEISAENFRPVPFVTSSRLQTVHSLGHGFARKINNSKIAMSDNRFEDDLQSIDSYVQNAISLASNGAKRTNAYEPNMFTNIKKSLYNRKDVSDEWTSFLVSLGKQWRL